MLKRPAARQAASGKKLLDPERQLVPRSRDNPAAGVANKHPIRRGLAAPTAGDQARDFRGLDGEPEKFCDDLVPFPPPIHPFRGKDEIRLVAADEKNRGGPAEGVEDLQPGPMGKENREGEFRPGRFFSPGQTKRGVPLDFPDARRGMEGGTGRAAGAGEQRRAGQDAEKEGTKSGKR